MAKNSLAQVSNFLQKMESAREVSDRDNVSMGRVQGVAALRSDLCPRRRTRSWQPC